MSDFLKKLYTFFFRAYLIREFKIKLKCFAYNLTQKSTTTYGELITKSNLHTLYELISASNALQRSAS
jgi:hypothetical protein